MASVFFGIKRGENAYQVTRNSSAQAGKDFEFEVDLANSPTRDEAVTAMEKIKDAIMRGPWPPVA
jgi:hypothetical protein